MPYATGVQKIKIRGRENISVGIWNVRTLRPAKKLEQLTHAIGRYHWNILWLCEMRRKNFGEMLIEDGHVLYFSGEENKHKYEDFLCIKACWVPSSYADQSPADWSRG